MGWHHREIIEQFYSRNHKSGYPLLGDPQKSQGTWTVCRGFYEERLLIFSNNPGSKTGDGGRAHAERMVTEMVQDRWYIGILRNGDLWIWTMTYRMMISHSHNNDYHHWCHWKMIIFEFWHQWWYASGFLGCPMFRQSLIYFNLTNRRRCLTAPGEAPRGFPGPRPQWLTFPLTASKLQEEAAVGPLLVGSCAHGKPWNPLNINHLFLVNLNAKSPRQQHISQISIMKRRVANFCQ